MRTAPELARFIRDRRRQVIELWEREATTLPGTYGLPGPALLDATEDVLAAVAELVESLADEHALVLRCPGVPAAHVFASVELGASLPLAIAELGVLRRVIERLWLDRPGEEAPPVESIQGPLGAAVEALMIHATRRSGQVRTRLFDALERIGVGFEGQHLPQLLAELLRIAQEDIRGVDAAAVLVREGDLLRTRAAVGLEREDGHAAPTRIGEGFVGLIAAERRPVLVSNASADPLVRRASLVASGLRAVYGVPLVAPTAADDPVVGVAFMGSRARDDFSEEARLRFRIIASRAAALVHEAQLRERLEEERARFLAFADTSPAIVFWKRADGRYEFMSRRAVELLGYSPEAFLGRTDREVWTADVAARIERDDRRVTETRSSVTFEEVIPTRDGRPRIYMTSKFPVLDAAGRVAGVGAVATDITDRKRREEAQALLARAGTLLAESFEVEATLSTLAGLIVPSLADCCIVDMVDDDGSVRRLRVVHRDPARADLVRALHDVPADPSRPHLTHAALDARRPVFMPEVPPSYLETLARTPEERRVLDELAPRSIIQVPFLTRGRLVGAFTLISTSTDRRYGRDDLTVAEDLARLASLTIDNARLYAAAQQALRARDEVLAVVAHDLRNPLNTVLGAVTAVLGAPADADPEGHRRRLELAANAARRAGRLTNDLLDVARLEAGRFVVRPAPAPAGGLLEDAAEAQRAALVEAGLELQVDAPPGLPRVAADRDRVQQVLENLVCNAARHTPRGGRVVLRAAAEPRGVRFEVEDTGPGIPDDERARVFDRFWQGRRASRRGAGLGLPIARGIVEAHRGRIWIESPPGGGTRVCFTLPLVGEG